MSRTTRETDGCGGPPPELQVLFTQQPATTDSRCHPPTVKLIVLLPRKLQRNYATRARGEISRQRWSEPSRFLVSRLHAARDIAGGLPRDLPVSPAARARHDARNRGARAVPPVRYSPSCSLLGWLVGRRSMGVDLI